MCWVQIEGQKCSLRTLKLFTRLFCEGVGELMCWMCWMCLGQTGSMRVVSLRFYELLRVAQGDLNKKSWEFMSCWDDASRKFSGGL